MEAAVDHIRGYQRRSERPFLFETATSYLRPQPDELSDATFITEIAERADCGILLDLHNLWANERNGRQPVEEVLDALPLERVLEVHLAGGFEADGYYLDAHVGGVDPVLVEMAAGVLPMLPNLRAVVFEVVGEHLLQLGPLGTRSVLATIQRLLDAPARRWDHRCDRVVARPADRSAAEEWERRLLMATTAASPTDDAEDPGVAVLRMLTQSARLGRVTAGAPARSYETSHHPAGA